MQSATAYAKVKQNKKCSQKIITAINVGYWHFKLLVAT